MLFLAVSCFSAFCLACSCWAPAFPPWINLYFFCTFTERLNSQKLGNVSCASLAQTKTITPIDDDWAALAQRSECPLNIPDLAFYRSAYQMTEVLTVEFTRKLGNMTMTQVRKRENKVNKYRSRPHSFHCERSRERLCKHGVSGPGNRVVWSHSSNSVNKMRKSIGKNSEPRTREWSVQAIRLRMQCELTQKLRSCDFATFTLFSLSVLITLIGLSFLFKFVKSMQVTMAASSLALKTAVRLPARRFASHFTYQPSVAPASLGKEAFLCLIPACKPLLSMNISSSSYYLVSE